MSGVHATIAAVLAAFVIPADSQIPESTFIARLRRQLHRFENAESNDVRTLEEEQVEIISQVKDEAFNAVPPLQRLEHGMHPFVSFVIMPIFALANAGVAFIDMDLQSLFSNHVALGVMFGLLLGKPLGIVLAVWLLHKLGLGKRSKKMTWHRIFGLGFLARLVLPCRCLSPHSPSTNLYAMFKLRSESSQLPLLVVWQDITCSK